MDAMFKCGNRVSEEQTSAVADGCSVSRTLFFILEYTAGPVNGDFYGFGSDFDSG
jgi:hypothetical protein